MVTGRILASLVEYLHQSAVVFTTTVERVVRRLVVLVESLRIDKEKIAKFLSRGTLLSRDRGRTSRRHPVTISRVKRSLATGPATIALTQNWQDKVTPFSRLSDAVGWLWSGYSSIGL